MLKNHSWFVVNDIRSVMVPFNLAIVLKEFPSTFIVNFVCAFIWRLGDREKEISLKI